MKIFAVFLLVLSIIFPIFHLLNVIMSSKANMIYKSKHLKSGVTILIPCFNEMKIIERSIKGVNHIDYNNYEVIYINDGSSDLTFQLLKKNLNLIPAKKEPINKLEYKSIKGFYQSLLFDNIYVIDKDNGGKADSLNAGISYSSNELIITLDADSILAPNSLEILNSVFYDSSIVAGGGLVKVLQGYNGDGIETKRITNLIKLQTLEYLKGFFILKASLSRINAMQVISGAFGIFRKSILMDVDGYRNTIGEDIDITIKIQQKIMNDSSKKVVFIPEAECYTECPESFKDLYQQRIRWQKAFMDCIIRYGYTLLKNIFVSKLAIFMLMDAFLVGTIATFFTIGSFLFLFLFTDTFKMALLIYTIVSTLIYLSHNLIALSMSSVTREIKSTKTKLSIATTVLIDILIWRFINCFFIIAGTLSYPFSKKWIKIERSEQIYEYVSEYNET
ncbi:glycosyltransferase family 2 protein [Brassicibacter mesophilus]|uniref:glycosyltransferase family 2 protein n=1 Tax=Brassicibacter mesophilus TaxID=745119 RepID=UPI003D1A0E5F